MRELAHEFGQRAPALLRRDPGAARDMARRAQWLLEGTEDDGARDLLKRLELALAEAALLLGEFHDALGHCDVAEAILRGLEPASDTLHLENLRVQALVHCERFDEAEARGRRALAAAGEAAASSAANWMRMNLADLAFRRDRPREALDLYAEVERLLPPHAPITWRAAVAANRANALEASSRFRAAERHFALATRLFGEAGCEHTVAQVAYNAAYAASLRGRYGDALRSYEALEPVFRKFQDERHLAHIELDRAEVHLHLHMHAEAESHALNAMSAFASLDLMKEEAQAVLLAARSAEEGGRRQAARGRYAQAEGRFAALGLTAREVGCRVQRAREAIERGKFSAAEEHLAAGRRRRVEHGGALVAIGLDLVGARLALGRRQGDHALRLCAGVREAARRIDAPWVHLEMEWIQARAHRLQGAAGPSLGAYRRAIDLLERRRVGVPPDEYMTAFLAGHADLYSEVIELLVAEGEVDEAFHMAERAKSRALVDLLVGRADAPHGEGSPEVTGRMQVLRERLAALYRRMAHDDGSNDVRSARTLRRAQREAERMEVEVTRIKRVGRLREEEQLSLRAVAAPDLAEVRRDLGQDVTLLEFVLTRTSLLAFVVSADRMHVIQRPLDAAALRERLQRFRFHISCCERAGPAGPSPLQVAAAQANLTALAELLLGPIREHVHTPRVVIVPDGALHHVPFHALPWSGDDALIDHFEVAYAPSAAVYRYCQRTRPKTTDAGVAVLGLPDETAPDIRREAEAVASDPLHDRLFMGDEATYARLCHEASRARVLHIATHGMFRPERPMLSAIQLSDAWISLHDLYDLRINSELVVLSACESGTAGVSEGNEILGLTRGLLYAGAPCLVASQWRVSDVVTTVLMDRFYAGLRRGRGVGAALRAAMKAVRRTHPHPYYWAPFFLVGRPSHEGPWRKPLQRDATPRAATPTPLETCA